MQIEHSSIENPCSRDRFILTKELSIQRRLLIENLAYSLFFSFKHFCKSYEVETLIQFDLSQKCPLVLECGSLAIRKLVINGFIISNDIIQTIWMNNALFIPDDYLNQDHNTIEIKTRSRFSRTGSGFHSYIDHQQKAQYCYTVCPPNFAHTIYPCFDQPDLKATFELKVKAPLRWTAISNSRLITTKREGRLDCPNISYKRWIFEKTPKLSTYLFSIAAGNFMTVNPQTPTKVLMRLFCTQDKQQALLQEYQDFFSLVEDGILFYESFFGTPFPFTKYDQVFCPEFKYLAMENPGMVCMKDTHIFFTESSPNKKIERALTILHELSHMWFGNLVTMKWWDDIWLNEGFASYIAYYALQRIRDDPTFETLDVNFFSEKQKALNIDGLSSTHSVQQNVEDTEAATNIFDDITYAKGSAVVKHLIYIIGEEKFSKSLEIYFKQYQWINASSHDFFNIIKEVLRQTYSDLECQGLEKWIQDWIYTEGKISLSYDFVVKDNMIELIIKQNNFPARVTVNKSVCLEIVVFSLNENQILTKLKIRKTHLNSQEEIVRIDLGKSDLQQVGIVLNYGDYAYADVLMDNRTLDLLLSSSDQLEPLVRAQLFFTLTKNVQSGQMNPIELFKYVSNEFMNGAIPCLYSEYLIQCSRILEYYLPKTLKESCGKLLFSALFSSLDVHKTGSLLGTSELFLTVQEYILDFAGTNDDVALVISWIQENSHSSTCKPISNTLLGRVIEEVFWRNLLDEEQRNCIKHSYTNDQPYYIYFIAGAIADVNSKLSLWKNCLSFNGEEGSQFEFSCMMKGLNNPHNYNDDFLVERFFNDILEVFNRNENEYSTTFFRNLFPKSSNSQYLIQRVEEFTNNQTIAGSLRSLLEEKLEQLTIRQMLEKFVSI